MKFFWVMVLAFAAELPAQTSADSSWLRPFGGRDEDLARVIRQMPDGGYLLAGTVTDVFAGAIVLVRTDSAGHIVWQRRIEEPRAADVRDVQFLSDGFLLAGAVRIATDRESPFLLRLDEHGQTQWTQRYEQGGRGGAHAVRVLPDGDVVLAGWSVSAGASQMDVLLLRTDSRGQLRWSRTYGGGGDEWAADLCATADGFALAMQAGEAGDRPGAVGLLLTDTLGTLVGLCRYPAQDLGWVQAITAVGADGFAIAWSRTASGWWDPETAGLDRLDSAGELLWREVYAAAGTVESRLMLRPVPYGFVLMGYAVSMGGGPRMLHVLKIDPDGALRSARAADGLGYTHWTRRRHYWHYELADPFGVGLADFFSATWGPPAAAIAVLPEAPVPERPRRRAPFDSFSNVFQARFTLCQRQQVTVQLLDTAGRLVHIFACDSYPAGEHFEVIDGWALPGGIYFLRIDTGERQLTQKVVFIR